MGGVVGHILTDLDDDVHLFDISSPGELLDYYTLGPVLGQGGFGVVYQCTKNGRSREYAVKMIDKVEAPEEEIIREAEITYSLRHPNIIRVYEVFCEQCFVCIVMDKYKGGDMIVGMHRHWQSKGRIEARASLHIMRQMAASVDFLHSRNIVHRDIKGENYLMDRSDIIDKGCKICLTDFGSATQVHDGERLTDSLGTRSYWAPEFFNNVYGLKVDIWAIGVVVYGILAGRKPFNGEQDVRYKKVVLPDHVPNLCKSFILEMLEKEEDKRPSAAEVKQHQWLQQMSAGASGRNAPEEVFEGDLMRESGPNEGVQKRRQELVERLQKKENSIQQTSNFGNRIFEVLDTRTNWKHTFEWWSEKKVEEEGVLKLEGLKQESKEAWKDADPAGAQSRNAFFVGHMLRDHNIDIDLFGKGEAKTLEQFAAEVHSGAARLMLDAKEHKKLVRVVDIVLLRLSFGNDKRKVYLVESGEQYHDGRERSHLNRLPGTKKEPFENTKRTAQRILADMLNMRDCKVTFDFAKREVYEDEDVSPSYPGVMTVYRKEIVAGEVNAMAGPAVLKRIGLEDLTFRRTPLDSQSGPCMFTCCARKDPDTFLQSAMDGGSSLRAPPGTWSFEDSKQNTKFFTWMNERQCREADVNLRAPTDCDEVSGLVQAPIGYEKEALKAFLKEHEIDPSQFGKGETKTLNEFSNELIKGESSLMVDQHGALLRVVDIVLLKLTKAGTTELLVETLETRPEGKIVHNRLPGSKCRPDENQFVTAQRILRRQLMVDENHVNLNATDVQIMEEQKDSHSYPGLTTMYRKRIIKGEISVKELADKMNQ